MSSQSTNLAARLNDASAAFIDISESCSTEQWHTLCPDEGWSVGASTQHVAGGMQFHAGHIVRMARGRPIVHVTMDQIDESNRAHESTTPDQAETVEALRSNSARLADIVGGITDEQLALSQPIPFVNNGQVMTTAEIIEHIAIWHIETHLESVRAAIDSIRIRPDLDE